jgi:3-oxoacyl-[acyl-carrier protein] reductase
MHIAFDLSDYKNLKNIYWNQLKKIGQIESVIHNAAYAYDDLISNANVQTLEYMYKVNVLSPVLLTKYSIRDMLLNNIKGSIVFVTSISAHKGFKGLSMYASTKGALEAFSKNIAKEWGAKGIRSNCVCPGFMETEMSSNISSEMKMKIFNRTSLKKATDIKSVASSVAFLTSNESNSITGQTIIVDCGTI